MDVFGPIDDILSGVGRAARKTATKAAKRAANRAEDWASQVANRARYAESNPLGFMGSAVTEGLKNSGAGAVRFGAYIGENAVKTAKGQQSLGQARKNIRNTIAIDAAADAIGAATGYVGGAVVRAGLKPGLRHTVNAAGNLVRGERPVLMATSTAKRVAMKKPVEAMTDVNIGAIRAIDPKTFYPISEWRASVELNPGDNIIPEFRTNWLREERGRNVSDMLGEWARTSKYGPPIPGEGATIAVARVKPQNLISQPGAAPGVHVIAPSDLRPNSFRRFSGIRPPSGDYPQVVDNWYDQELYDPDTGDFDRPLMYPSWQADEYDRQVGNAGSAGYTYYNAGGVKDDFFMMSAGRYPYRTSLEVPLYSAVSVDARRNKPKKNTKRNVR